MSSSDYQLSAAAAPELPCGEFLGAAGGRMPDDFTIEIDDREARMMGNDERLRFATSWAETKEELCRRGYVVTEWRCHMSRKYKARCCKPGAPEGGA